MMPLGAMLAVPGRSQSLRPRRPGSFFNWVGGEGERVRGLASRDKRHMCTSLIFNKTSMNDKVPVWLCSLTPRCLAGRWRWARTRHRRRQRYPSSSKRQRRSSPRPQALARPHPRPGLEVSCSIPPHYPARTVGALLEGVLSAAPQAARSRAAMARTEAATTAGASSKLTRCSFTKAPAVSELDSSGGGAEAAKGTRLSSSALTSASRRSRLRVGGCLRPERIAFSPTPTHVVPRRDWSVLLCLHGRHLLLNNGRGCPGTLRLGVQEQDQDQEKTLSIR